MSPSPGGALVSCVKRAVPEREMNWHRQDYTQQVNKGCDTRSLICLLPAAPFWYWQPAAVAQSISGSLRRPALQYACTRHNEESTAGVRIERTFSLRITRYRTILASGIEPDLCLARQCPRRCVPDSSRASHLFAALVGRTSCLKHLACTFRLF